MNKLITLLIVIISASDSFGQEFMIKKIEVTPNSTIIHYDLKDTTVNRLYSIYVYSSKDNFIAPLQKVQGDVGLDVHPGLNKKITWQSMQELGATFTGDVELEIRGRVYIPFIRFTGLQENTKIKRGVAKTLAWTGGTAQNVLNFQLYKGDELIYQTPPVPNTSRSTSIQLPMSVKPGKGYRFVVSDVKNKDLIVKTSTFTVKRKYPLIVKAVPVLLIGGLVYYLTLPKDDKLMSGPTKPPPTTD